MDINEFINDKYRILLLLNDYKGPDGYSRLSQSELAEKLNLSRVTINKYVKELINDKYISIEKDHLSKFKILKKTEKIVEILITLKNCMIE